MCKVSAIIITKELNSKINETLTSLLSQTFEDYEIICVCHKNSLQTLPITAIPIKVVVRPNTSRGTARNIGVANSSGKVIAFTDDDCVVEKDWLRKGFKTLDENERIAVVGGPVKVHETLPKFSQIALNIISIPFINGWSVTFSIFPTKREVSYVPTCNAFFKKETLERVGGFRDINYCEDVEICSRIKKLGYKIIYDPEVEVRHKWKIWSWRSFVRHFYSYGKGRGYVMVKYPHIGKTNISPSVVLSLLLISIPLLILEPKLLLFIVISSIMFLLFSSIYVYRKFRRIKYLLLTPFLMISMYLSYMLGLFVGLFMGRKK